MDGDGPIVHRSMAKKGRVMDKIKIMIDKHLSKPKGLEKRIKPKLIIYTGSDLTQEDLQRMAVGIGVSIIYQARSKKEMHGEDDQNTH